MGLHAAVYKNPEELPDEIAKSIRSVDSSTGEIEFSSTEEELRFSPNFLYAIMLPLGNMSSAAWLRAEIRKRYGVLGNRIVDSFLYSGCHSGDSIPLDQVLLLEKDIAAIGEVSAHLPDDLRLFIERVRTLVTAAIREKNPIVFL